MRCKHDVTSKQNEHRQSSSIYICSTRHSARHNLQTTLNPSSTDAALSVTAVAAFWSLCTVDFTWRPANDFFQCFNILSPDDSKSRNSTNLWLHCFNSSIKKLSATATVSSANWKIADQNYYCQFGELSWKNQKLLKAVWRSEVQLIRILGSTRRTYWVEKVKAPNFCSFIHNILVDF